MAILEAAAYGLPTVCTAECNLPELYAAGAGCTMSLNVDDMANDLASFLSLSEDSRQDMGSAARRLVQSSFQWASVASKFEAVYAWAANGGPRPSYVLLD
jgi:poly(glycerol-phosphate) alpha-glucosyltransferase